MADQYHLRVTAGPSYDVSTHKLLEVNTPKSTHVSTPKINAAVNVRVQNYRGLPLASPKTSPYFANAPHTHDLYSISFSFTLPASSDPILGTDLVFGSDFAHSISKSLPPGFNSALRIVKWVVDPGLDGDVYADQPYLYGPLLSSINVLRIEDEAGNDAEESKGKDTDDSAWEEGSAGKGEEVRKTHNIPATGPARMKHFLNDAAKKDFQFEPGMTYKCDFFNPYLDFNEFSLKLPGFTLGIMKYWDGQPLRYVLKHKTRDGSIDEPLFVIQFTLIPNEEVEKEEQKWITNGSTNQDRSEKAEEEDGTTDPVKTENANYVDEGVD